jgi:two-component system phosphate regulon sensor histidine kinase PhoR
MPGLLKQLRARLSNGSAPGAAEPRHGVAALGPAASAVFDGAGDKEAALLAALAEGVLLVDDAGRVRRVNPAACRLLGSPAGELVGQTVLEATHRQSLADLIEGARQSAQATDAITVRVTGGGTTADEPRTLRARAVPGSVSAADIWLLLEDQTELTHLRTVRTEFVANVSHELRTPLAAIRATAETLAEGPRRTPILPRVFWTRWCARPTVWLN